MCLSTWSSVADEIDVVVCVFGSRCSGFTVIVKPPRLVNIRKSPVHMQVTGNSPNAQTKKVCVHVCVKAVILS